jgi:hypothetical protein
MLRYLPPGFFIFALLSQLLADPGLGVSQPKPTKVDYNRDIRPILSEHCLKCHGMDVKTREADLRLDVREDAIKAGAITPQDLQRSEIWARLHSTDPDEIMPPPETKRVVSAAQKELIKRWIEQGADYADHWAFIPPQRSAVPVIKDSAPRMPLDAFLLQKQQEKGLTHAPEASREEWLRRVTLDLTGLPPTLEAMDSFATDTSPLAYERVVSRLLASPAFGESMGVDWLDVSRYADTYGRHEDGDCTTWPYRDWVIQALNQNLPYDQFITHQTAGDMLPGATEDQIIATCFNRLAQQSNEAGSDAEEFRIEQVADRVKTNGLAFLGLSIECARCHDHKYDPISQRDFYGMAAMLNNIDELGLFGVYVGGSPPPTLQLYSDNQKQRRATILQRISQLEVELASARAAGALRYQKWLEANEPPYKNKPGTFTKALDFFSSPKVRSTPRKPVATYRFDKIKDKRFFINHAHKSKHAEMHNIGPIEPGRKGQAFRMSGDNWVTLEGLPPVKRSDPFSIGLWIKPFQSFSRALLTHRSRAGLDAGCRGIEVLLDQDRPTFALVHFHPGNEVRIRTKKPVTVNEWTQITCTYDGSSKAAGLRIYINGQLAETDVVKDNLYRDVEYRADWNDDTSKDSGQMLNFNIGARTNDGTFSNGLIDEYYFYDVAVSPGEVKQLALKDDHMDPADWLSWYLSVVDQEYRGIQDKLHLARTDENVLSGQAVDYMVMQENSGTRRPTHLLSRGQFNQPLEELQPDLPKSVLAFDPKGPRNRLGLAQWLTDQRNPLTARVAVNRIWQHFFITGLVSTSEDFGTQGQPPSHPELLDDMAVRFMEEGWDVKRLCREIVLSAAYRQAGESPTAQADPENRYLTRGPRTRLKAEQVRDAALASSGMLVQKMGGPSVKPYQPAGLWEEAGTQHTYAQDKGESLYRRSMYTFWRRTLPPPTMTLFDAPSRENCKVRRERTGTPLQSLVLMNDPQFMEASRKLAERLVRQHSKDDAARARDAYRLLINVQPTAQQLELMTALLREERSHMQTDAKAAEELLKKNGSAPPDAQLPQAEVAATTLMVRMLFGFNETLMKP